MFSLKPLLALHGGVRIGEDVQPVIPDLVLHESRPGVEERQPDLLVVGDHIPSQQGLRALQLHPAAEVALGVGNLVVHDLSLGLDEEEAHVGLVADDVVGDERLGLVDLDPSTPGAVPDGLGTGQVVDESVPLDHHLSLIDPHTEDDHPQDPVAGEEVLLERHLGAAPNDEPSTAVVRDCVP